MTKLWMALALIAGLFVAPSVASAQASSVTIDWEAPGDDADTGVANHYEMRYSSAAIVGTDTTSWWNAATVVSGLPTPLAPFTTQSVVVNGTFLGGVTYYVVMRAVDEASNASAYSNVASKTIPSNAQPVVTNPGNRTINELTSLTFTASATDADLGTVFSWSLDPGFPAGVSINGSTGAFAWTPTEAQGAGVYPITLRATDNGSPPSSGTATFTVTVVEVNVAPAVTSPGDRTVNELVPLTFTLTATDSDLPANTVTRTIDPTIPAGASLNPSTGAFTWTPSEAQGAGTYPVTFRATDNGSPVLSSSASITVTVNEVNVAPSVANPGNRTVAEMANLAFTVTATDPDVPSNTITWSMDGGGPSGATLNSATGAFSWTPTEAQGPGSFPVTIRATDSGTPNMSGTATFTITVASSNQAPVVASPGDKTVDELSTLSFPMTATDADIPVGTMSWSIDVPVPAGAQIVPVSLGNATFSWTPSEAQGPGTYPITVRVTDNGAPALGGTTAFAVTVNEVNVAPVFTSYPQGTPSIPITVGVPWSYTITATDADVPANALTYETTQVPAEGGVTLGASTGVFTITAVTAGTKSVTVRVVDSGSPQLSTTGPSITFTATGGASPDVLAPASTSGFANVSGLQYTATAPTKNQDGACPGGASGTTLLDLNEVRIYANITGIGTDTLLAHVAASPGQSLSINVFLAPGSSGTIWSAAADSVGNESCDGTVLNFSVPAPPAGLLGEYFDGPNFTSTEVERFDAKIFYTWDAGSPMPSMGNDTFSVRWTGYVTPQHSETYTFYVTSDDGMVIWIDDVQIAGVWTDHPVKEYKGTVALLAGRQYPIRVEYYENLERSLAKVFWSSPSTNKQAVPASALSH